ncbi:MAG: hypothetical protein QOI88_3151 [Gammaproteobacteria bacterium]|jgi:hypothetical protein|nr:hypothetical protein [Gammaproteobacteria bacterium]
MRFRLAAMGLHLLASGIVLTVILGGLYLGWYRWPGWYLADAIQVTLVLAGVDLVAGPLLTFIIASPAKPRRVLMRDVAVIATVQLIALTYGTMSLWNGRPLYYAFSEDVLSLVQAYDIEDAELAIARKLNAPLLPHWYNLPRWIWAPLPQDSAEQNKIIASAVTGGSDVISMPRYYKPWDAGLPELRMQLKKIDDLKYFSGNEKKLLKERVRAAGLAADQPNTLALTGRGRPLLAVWDPANLKILGVFRAK